MSQSRNKLRVFGMTAVTGILQVQRDPGNFEEPLSSD